MAIRWGKAGAGILFFCEDECLLTLRSNQVEESMTWGVPGGSVAGEERFESYEIDTRELDLKTYLSGATKEVIEELGSLPDDYSIYDEVVYQEGGFTYVTFFAEISKKSKNNWKHVLNWENVDARWFLSRELPPTVHFGVKYLIEKRPDLLRQSLSSENKVLVDNPPVIYHGTSLTNLWSILESGGLSPGKGYSPHKTITTNALFYSSEFEAALFYSHNPRVILEVSSDRMVLHPDWDDAATLIEIDLSELQSEFGDIHLGGEIPEGLVDDIEEYLEFSCGDRAEPATLEIGSSGGHYYLLASPFVCLPVNEEAMNIRPELYDDFQFSDGTPCLLSQQFLCYDDLGIDSIDVIWVEAAIVENLSLVNHITSSIKVENFNTILNLENSTYNDNDNVIFEEITMYAIDTYDLIRLVKNARQPFRDSSS